MVVAKSQHKIFFVALLCLFLGACSAGKTRDAANQDFLDQNLIDEKSASAKARKGGAGPLEPGIIHIERHTEDYSISLILDASDDNIYFEMDLPEGQKPEDMLNGAQPTDDPKKADPKDAKPGADATDTQKLKASDDTKYILYAQTYFFEKKYARALDEISKAVDRNPDSAVAHSLKGSIQYKLDDKVGARASWQKALELDPNLDNVKAMLNKLDGK